jgi:hypothetical protein
MSIIPATWKNQGPGQPRHKANNQHKKELSQVIEYLLSKYKALKLTPSTTEKEKETLPQGLTDSDGRN